MADKLVMLALSPTMEEGKIVDWKVSEGDSFSEGDVLCEVETDKASMEYESPEEGTILKIITEAGASVKVGAVIALFGESGEDISDLLKSIEPGPADSSPEDNSLRTKENDQVAAGPAIAAASVSAEEPGSHIKASPLARKIAADRGINIRSIIGSGPGGRVVKRDVEHAEAAPLTTPGGLPRAGHAALHDEVIEISQKRKIIARRLGESKFSAPHFYLSVDVIMGNMIAARTALNKGLKDRKVSFNSFFIKLAAEAIKKHPAVNATWNDATITRHGSIDIGLAVAQPDGLVTPVVRDCAGKGIVRIDSELVALIEKARNGKLAPEEYNGATFTISNLGSFGIDRFTAIINPPGSAILAIGQAKKKPVVIDDEIVVRTCLTLTLSCDHRVIDGAVGAAFLNELKNMLEEPVRALF